MRASPPYQRIIYWHVPRLQHSPLGGLMTNAIEGSACTWALGGGKRGDQGLPRQDAISRCHARWRFQRAREKKKTPTIPKMRWKWPEHWLGEALHRLEVSQRRPHRIACEQQHHTARQAAR